MRPARFILAEQNEVSGVGDQDEPVLVPVLAYLIAFGCQPCVVTNGLNFQHSAFRELSLAVFAFLDLSCSVESEVGMTSTLLGKLTDAEHLGLERAADSVEKVG